MPKVIGVATATRACMLAAHGHMEGVKAPQAITGYEYVPIVRSFTERPNGSNSKEQELSMVICQTETRFLIICRGYLPPWIRWTIWPLIV